LKDIASFFISLFQELKLPARWVAIFSLVVFVLVGIFGYEQLTGHFYLTKLEIKVSLLKELQAIASEGTENHPELETIYEQIVSELSVFEVRTIASYMPTFEFTDTITLGKAISGAFLWIIILILGLSSEAQKNGKLTGMDIGLGIFLLLIAVLFAWVGTLIPTIYNPWINYLLFPSIQFVILLILSRKKKPAKV
jgi:hypothetical protein